MHTDALKDIKKKIKKRNKDTIYASVYTSMYYIYYIYTRKSVVHHFMTTAYLKSEQ